MSRIVYPVTNQTQQADTTPPKIYDMKYYLEYIDPEDDAYWNPEKILFSFTFSGADSDKRAAASQFHVEIQDLETGKIESFIQLYNKPYYRFWQRQAQQQQEDTSKFIINSRVTITPMNDFGEGKKSTFLLPLRDLVQTRSKENNEIFSILNSNWSLFSETPDDRENRPKIMYIYLGVDDATIEADRTKLSTTDWQFDSLTSSSDINDRTYRWSVDSTHRKLSQNGWNDSTQAEQTFITDLIQSMLPDYREYLTRKGLSPDENYIFKMGIENPKDNRDTIVIYLLKGTEWKI